MKALRSRRAAPNAGQRAGHGRTQRSPLLLVPPSPFTTGYPGNCPHANQMSSQPKAQESRLLTPRCKATALPVYAHLRTGDGCPWPGHLTCKQTMYNYHKPNSSVCWPIFALFIHTHLAVVEHAITVSDVQLSAQEGTGAQELRSVGWGSQADSPQQAVPRDWCWQGRGGHSARCGGMRRCKQAAHQQQGLWKRQVTPK